MEQPINTPQKNQQFKQMSSKNKHLGLWISVAINVILLAAVGWLWWQLKVSMDQAITLENNKKQLQSQIDALKKEAADKTTATANSAACTAKPITQALKDNIKASVVSKNTAALEGYMASSVKFVVAASEKGGSESPTAAINDLTNFLADVTGTWDFALSTATLNSYKAGFYGALYFGANTYVGKETGGKVVSFDFDSCGKINQIFVAADASLLLP